MTQRIRQFERDPEVNKRLRILYISAIVLFFFIILRLYYLQVIKYSYFYNLSEENRVRLRPVRAPRGLILDKNGVILADSKPAFQLVCTPYDVVDVEGELRFLGEIVDFDEIEVKQKILKAKKENPFGNINIATDLTFEQVSAIEINLEHIPGFSISYEARRNYPLGLLTAHALGYVGEAGVNDLKKFKNDGVIFGDYVGKSGTERMMEHVLHGRDGVRRLEVDALGREKKEIGFTNPDQGQTMYLSLDIELQREAARLLKGRSGAIFGMNPKNGEVYVLYSSPSYDPNLFARGIRVKEWEALLRDKKKPLQNRVIQGLYAPGSTIKPILALLSFQEGFVSPDTEFLCTGEFQLAKSKFRCWKKGGHGRVKLMRAIVESCDIYFYNLGLTSGINNISRWSMLFGLNEGTGIDIPAENKGIVPARIWKMQRFGERWYHGDTVVASIGQGYFATTPQEMVVAYSALANGGKLVMPRLVKKVQSFEEERVSEPIVRREIDLETEKLALIRNALEGVVSSVHGTGRRAGILGVRVSGKTGTAQVVALPEKDIPKEELAYSKKDHAWFIGYAPADDPEICIAVVVEHGGSGGKIAAPLFKDIVRKYFALKGEV
jgi:penicillin-binding protein 2